MLFEPWIYHEAIRARAAEIAGHLALRFGKEPVRIIPVLRGGMEFANLLGALLSDSEHPPVSVSVDPIHVKSYAGVSSRELQWIKRPDGPARPDTHDVLIEDIADTAQTLTTVEAELRQQNAASFTTVVMLNRPEARAPEHRDYQPDIAAFEIRNPEAWAIGCGLDLNGRYRELPDIYGKVSPDADSLPPYHLPPLPHLDA